MNNVTRIHPLFGRQVAEVKCPGFAERMDFMVPAYRSVGELVKPAEETLGHTLDPQRSQETKDVIKRSNLKWMVTVVEQQVDTKRNKSAPTRPPQVASVQLDEPAPGHINYCYKKVWSVSSPAFAEKGHY